jgi:hypothetical protein
MRKFTWALVLIAIVLPIAIMAVGCSSSGKGQKFPITEELSRGAVIDLFDSLDDMSKSGDSMIVRQEYNFDVLSRPTLAQKQSNYNALKAIYARSGRQYSYSEFEAIFNSIADETEIYWLVESRDFDKLKFYSEREIGEQITTTLVRKGKLYYGTSHNEVDGAVISADEETIRGMVKALGGEDDSSDKIMLEILGGKKTTQSDGSWSVTVNIDGDKMANFMFEDYYGEVALGTTVSDCIVTIFGNKNKVIKGEVAMGLYIDFAAIFREVFQNYAEITSIQPLPFIIKYFSKIQVVETFPNVVIR